MHRVAAWNAQDCSLKHTWLQPEYTGSQPAEARLVGLAGSVELLERAARRRAVAVGRLGHTLLTVARKAGQHAHDRLFIQQRRC